MQVRPEVWISRPNYHCLRWAVSDSGPLSPGVELAERSWEGNTMGGYGNPHTRIEMRTDVNAVPCAGLGYHVLTVQLRTAGPGGLQKEKGPKVQSEAEPTSDHVCSRLPSSLDLNEILNFVQVHKKASLLASPVVSPSSLVRGQLTTAWTPC